MPSVDQVLVTGASGYLGSLITDNLISRGYSVLGLDIHPIRRAAVLSPEFRFFKSDITRPGTLPEEIRHASVLVHCAALVHRKSTDLSRDNYFEINHRGTQNILMALDPKCLRQVIYFSTVSVYGKMQRDCVPDEETPLEPMDYYGESKVAAEDEVRLFAQKNEIAHTIFRLAPVYGRRFLINLEKRVFLPKRIAFYRIGDGTQRLSLLSAGNAVHAVLECIKERNGYRGIFNLKDKDNYSINDVIYALQRLYNKPHCPIVRIPYGIPTGVSAVLQRIFPKNGSYFSYQLRKIAEDAVFSGEKLLSAGIKFPWNLIDTLLSNRIGTLRSI